jgi:hypothetical protein
MVSGVWGGIECIYSPSVWPSEDFWTSAAFTTWTGFDDMVASLICMNDRCFRSDEDVVKEARLSLFEWKSLLT